MEYIHNLIQNSLLFSQHEKEMFLHKTKVMTEEELLNFRQILEQSAEGQLTLFDKFKSSNLLDTFLYGLKSMFKQSKQSENNRDEQRERELEAEELLDLLGNLNEQDG